MSQDPYYGMNGYMNQVSYNNQYSYPVNPSTQVAYNYQGSYPVNPFAQTTNINGYNNQSSVYTQAEYNNGYNNQNNLYNQVTNNNVNNYQNNPFAQNTYNYQGGYQVNSSTQVTYNNVNNDESNSSIQDPFKGLYKYATKQDFEEIRKIVPKFDTYYDEYFSKLNVPIFDIKQITNMKSINEGNGLTSQTYTATLNGRTICVKVYNTFNEGINIYSNDDAEIAEGNNYFAHSFFREVSELLSLPHPFILKAYGISICERKLCVLSYYCKFDTIRSLYNRKQPAECLQHKFDYMMQIVLAIDYMHCRDKCHRDIKYENIFICDTESICIGDFGMTREIKEHLAKYTTNIGTPVFNAPEVESGSDAYDKKIDIYSLGFVLIYIITRIDLATATSIENMTAQTKKEIQKDGFEKFFKEKCRKDFPDKYKEIYNDCSLILLCLQERPENRPDSGELFKYCLDVYKKYSNVHTYYYKQMKDHYRQLAGKS